MIDKDDKDCDVKTDRDDIGDRQTGTRVPEMRQTCTWVPETDMHRGARDVMTDMETANQLAASIRVDL